MNIIAKQYKTSENLNTRISIHEKYSTNKQSFGDWIVSHYDIRPVNRILELGCGTGSMWKYNLHLLKEGTELILTDFSAGMLETAQQNVCSCKVSFAQADIQNIPYVDNSFDVVIANIDTVPRNSLLALLESRVENGILFVPKEYGMFICR